MKIIPFTDICQPRYPIGENVVEAIEYIDLVTPFIKEIVKNHPVNIWCSGSSGAILAAFLIKNLDNNCVIFHVKKEGEHSHHGNDFYKANNRKAVNIILDDFMRSGNTIERIYEKAENYCSSINILVLANCYKEDWRLSFIPNNLIIDKDSIHESWENLTPTRIIEKQEEQLINVDF